MLWLYERDDQALHVETRVDHTTGEYLAVLIWPDGSQYTERFGDAASFRVWLLQLEDQLQHGRWTLTGPAALLPDGWSTR